MEKVYVHKGGGISYCNIPTHFMSFKKIIISGQSLFDHIFYFMYAICLLGMIIAITEFSEGTNKGGNLIAVTFFVSFLFGVFLFNKKLKQKIVA